MGNSGDKVESEKWKVKSKKSKRLSVISVHLAAKKRQIKNSLYGYSYTKYGEKMTEQV
jgi:hypothetical protein